MKSSLLFKLLSISLLMLFLYSCGTSGNGAFEKRKHLKGWHFKKSKKINLGSVNSKAKEEFKSSKNKKTSDLSFHTLKIEKNSDHDFKALNIQVDSFQSKSPLLYYADNNIKSNSIIKNFESNKSKVSDSSNVLQKQEDLHLIKTFENVYEKNLIKEKRSDEPEVEDNRYLFGPILIILAIIGLLYLYLMGIGVAFALGLLAISVGLSWAVGIVIWMLLGYVVSALFLYILLRLFVRKDGEEIWSLKESFRKSLWFLLIVPLLYFSLLLLIGY
ncbi:hypothetical protein ERX46_10395 [Brumimicrobium glaciale]|uniref:Uncharacterized protein n=1 Tax=Brumimicrobium glaciale TaxID=200475 RepID=A0A4Q4KJ38_9FLAO|nr:hypothetical protein [Brumimicrobium glaciale]RYM33343.1 hypothetical protein ERX46_10395 [Brumimicrobium glaciale]